MNSSQYYHKDSLMGEVVTWHMDSSEVHVSKVRSALASAGLEPDILKDLNNRSAFKRACKHLKENRSIDKVNEHKNGIIEFQLTKKTIENATMRFDYETKIAIDITTGTIHCTDDEIRSKVTAMFNHAMQHRSSSDLTRLVQKLFKDNADLFSINPRKGVAYFVPSQHQDFLERVSQFFSNCGGSIDRWPVPKGNTNGEASVKKSVSNGISTLITELQDSVNDWDSDTRKDTMVRGYKKFKDIQHKIEAYTEYLKDSADELHIKLTEAKESLVRKYEQNQEAVTA